MIGFAGELLSDMAARRGLNLVLELDDLGEESSEDRGDFLMGGVL